jgi:hypothetical protein
MTSDSGSQYVAGFFDGDGTIKPNRTYGTPIVSFSQACDTQVPPELASIQQRWGGRVQKQGSPKSMQRQVWQLNICKKQDVIRILQDLQPHCVLKLPQIVDSIAFLQHRTKKDVEGFVSRMHDWKKRYYEVTIDPLRLTDAYIAGLFAAEGSVGLYRKNQTEQRYKFTVSITQSGCLRLLEQIRAKIGFGLVSSNPGRLMIQRRLDCRDILDRISPFISGQKAPQVELVRQFLQVIPTIPAAVLWAALHPFAD